MSDLTWKPLDTKVIIELKSKDTGSKIKLLDGSDADSSNKYMVVSDVGSGVNDVKAGDVVMIDAFCQKYSLDKTHFVIDRSSILAVGL